MDKIAIFDMDCQILDTDNAVKKMDSHVEKKFKSFKGNPERTVGEKINLEDMKIIWNYIELVGPKK